MTDLLYFATGDGANVSGEAYAAPANKLYNIQPVSATTLDLIFDNGRKIMNYDSVRLTITSNTHQNVIASIGKVISRNQGGSLITICDSDNSIFLNSNITDCTISLGISGTAFHTQNITGTAKGAVTVTSGSFDSLLLTAITDATVSLYLASQVGTDITATDVVAAETEAASTGSVTLTVDNGSGSASDAANDELLNEQIWKSDGTLFGTCTTVSSTTSLVFSGGLSNAITNNDVLYTGTRYYILKSVEIELGSTLKLEPDELNFNDDNHKLYITLASGSVDIITRQ